MRVRSVHFLNELRSSLDNEFWKPGMCSDINGLKQLYSLREAYK